MWNSILSMLAGQPKFKAIVEQMFNQPVDHVTGCFGAFLESVRKGPGIQNSIQEQQRRFDRFYQGGLAMGFEDWKSYLAAAILAGYKPMDVCLSFRNERGWESTTVEKIQQLSEEILPVFIEKGKIAGLIPPEMFPDTGIPKINMKTSGGKPPWETTDHSSGASGDLSNINAPQR